LLVLSLTPETAVQSCGVAALSWLCVAWLPGSASSSCMSAWSPLGAPQLIRPVHSKGTTSHVPAQPRRRPARTAPVAAASNARRRSAATATAASRPVTSLLQTVVPTTGRPLPCSSGRRQTRQWQHGGCNDSFQYGAIQKQPSCDIVAQGRPPQPGTRGHAARAYLTARANGRPPRATSPRQPAVRAGSDTRSTTRT